MDYKKAKKTILAGIIGVAVLSVSFHAQADSHAEKLTQATTERMHRNLEAFNNRNFKPSNCPAKVGHNTGELSIDLTDAPKRSFWQRNFRHDDGAPSVVVKDFERNMVKRKAWGAAQAPWEINPRAWKGKYLLGTPTDIVVHHTEGPQDQSIQSLQKVGMTGAGLDHMDISYHMLIKKVKGHWAFFEGRDSSRMGSHAFGTNGGRIGIAVVDNLLLHKPDPELVSAIAQAVAYYKAKYPTIRTLHTHGEGPHSAIPGHTNCGHNLAGPLAEIGRRQKFANAI